MTKHLIFPFAFAVLLIGKGEVFANQTSQITPAQRLSVDYFSQFNAQHALDIVTLTPGFVLNEGSSQRGLANTSGNVLINGIPIQTKTQSMTEALEDISIEQVELIDFYQGNHPFSSVSQHSQVINIKVNNNATRVDIETSLAIRDKKRALTEMNLQIQTPWQNWQHKLNIKALNSRYESEYVGIEYTQQAQPLSRQDEQFGEQLGEFQINTQSILGTTEGTVQLTSQFWTERWQTDFIHDFYNANATAPHRSVHTIEWLDMDEYQLGLDWQTMLNEDYELQLVGLTTDNKQRQDIRVLDGQEPPTLQNSAPKRTCYTVVYTSTSLAV